MWIKDFLSRTDANKEGCYFTDKRRRADYVIVPKGSMDPLVTYVSNLEQLGLEFEVVQGQTVNKTFILIHLPEKANKHFSQVYDVGLNEHRMDFRTVKPMWFSTLFTTPISFIPIKKKGEFTSAERIIIINKLLENTTYGNGMYDKGISRLIKKKVVETAYALHDGHIHNDRLMYSNDRQLLYHHWSKLSCWYKECPIDMIQKYYGCEIAFYFAFLEYFNSKLITAAFVGGLAIIINYMLVSSVPINQIEEICHEDNMWICPTCQLGKYCTFTKLSSYCPYAKYKYVFDNYITVGFAIFMSFWATSFVHWWRRKEIKLKLKWDVHYPHPALSIRGEYMDAAKELRLNRGTGQLEPYVKKHIIYLRKALSVSFCLFMTFLVIVGVFGMILFEVVFEAILDRGPILYFRENSTISYMITGSLLNVLVIKIFSRVYGKLCIWLTDLELPRTQNDYDKSYLYKRYLLSFVNNYLNFFYSAFLKGRLYTVPNYHNTHFTFLERDTCQPLSCIFSICIMMCFLLILKTFSINVVKIVIDNCRNCIGTLLGKGEISYEGIPQYEADYKLKPTERFLIASEFNSMVIAYGHVTLFVAAFPLAPLCVLLNNILEVRMLAHKLTVHSRRLTPRLKEGIGAWNGIMTDLTYLSTVTNAFVIAFTGSFIEREIYQHTVDYDLKGFVNSTLSKFATKDYGIDLISEGHINPNICYYKSLRFPPDHPQKYHLTSDYWIQLTWRFIFVLIFGHMIFWCNSIFGYLIPQIPRSVRIQLKLDKTLAKEAKLKLYGYRYRPGHPRRGTTVDRSASGTRMNRSSVASGFGMFQVY